MASMNAMAMPGGWTMSMMWMRMPGQSWPGFIAAFMTMWMLMMTAMMTPVIMPMLQRYRHAIRDSPLTHVELLTAAFLSGYLLTWILLGIAILVAGILLSTLAMRADLFAHAVPFLMALAISVAGLSQLSHWKIRQLQCCDSVQVNSSPRDAWRSGLRFGIRCASCCAPLTMVLLVNGMMEIHLMILVTSAIALERIRRVGVRAARLMGVAITATGLWLMAHAASHI
jgi:predicted metal-binding membrane protein